MFGRGTVTIVDGARILHTDIHETPDAQPAALLGLSVHVLTAGCGFDIDTRTPTWRHALPRAIATARPRLRGPRVKLDETRVYRGPSPYGYRPVIRLTLDLEELEEHPSDKIPGFVDRLLADVPSLEEHGCSYGERGGFIRRLRGRHLVRAHHRARRARAPVPRGHAGHLRQDARRRPRRASTTSSTASRTSRSAAARATSRSATSAASSPRASPTASRRAVRPQEGARRARAARRARRARALDAEPGRGGEAARHPDPAPQRPEPRAARLGQCTSSASRRRSRAETRHIAVEIAQDKQLTNSLLERAGLPVPAARAGARRPTRRSRSRSASATRWWSSPWISRTAAASR